MNQANLERLLTFAQHGQPVAYGGSDIMRADLEAVLLAQKQQPQVSVLILDAVAFVRAAAELPDVDAEAALGVLQNIRKQAVDLDAKLKPVLNEMAAGEKKPDFVIGERLPGESFSEYWVRFRRADQR